MHRYSLHQFFNKNVTGVLALGRAKYFHSFFKIEIRDIASVLESYAIQRRGNGPDNVINRSQRSLERFILHEEAGVQVIRWHTRNSLDRY